MKKKLVIEIDEEYYNDIKESDSANNYSVLYALDAIRNGTPLPKGHGRLIDANKLSYECMHENSSECNHMMCDTCQFNCVAKYEIEDSLTIIEADGGGEDEVSD